MSEPFHSLSVSSYSPSYAPIDSDLDDDEFSSGEPLFSSSSKPLMPAVFRFLIFRDLSTSEPSDCSDWRNWALPFATMALCVFSGVSYILAAESGISSELQGQHALEEEEFLAREWPGVSISLPKLRLYFDERPGHSPAHELLNSPALCLSRSLALSTALKGGGFLIILFGCFYCMISVGHLAYSNSRHFLRPRAVLLYLITLALPFFLIRVFGTIALLFFAFLAVSHPSDSDCVELARWAMVFQGFFGGLWIFLTGGSLAWEFIKERE